MNCDKILVMSEGKVAEFAPPAELLLDKVRYFVLVILTLHPTADGWSCGASTVLDILFHGVRSRLDAQWHG